MNPNWQKKFLAETLAALLAFRALSLAGLPLQSATSPQILTTLGWNASPSPEVVGYAVYYQVTGLDFSTRVDVGKSLTATLPLLVGVPHSIYAVAYTEDGRESAPSNVVQYTPPALTQLRLTRLAGGAMQVRFRALPLALCRVEWTDNLASPVWQTWAVLLADVNGDVVLTDSSAGGAGARFYRLARM